MWVVKQTEGWLQGEVHSVQIKFTINLSKLEKSLHGCILTLHTVKIIKYKEIFYVYLGYSCMKLGYAVAAYLL